MTSGQDSVVVVVEDNKWGRIVNIDNRCRYRIAVIIVTDTWTGVILHIAVRTDYLRPPPAIDSHTQHPYPTPLLTIHGDTTYTHHPVLTTHTHSEHRLPTLTSCTHNVQWHPPLSSSS